MPKINPSRVLRKKHVSLAWRYHCEILKACRAGDAAAAVYWLKTHIARSERDALMPLSRM